MRRKNKTLFLLLAGFVFLILASRLHFGSYPAVTTDKTVAEPVAAAVSQVVLEKLSVQNSIASDSAAITHPVAAAAPPLSRGESNSQFYPVIKVVDGDTIDILINGKTERLRLIGINTPEVVDPRKPVECFGKEASDNAKKLLDGQQVRIAADPSQDDKDIYGRSLRYVWRSDGLFYNLEAIQDGFAYEYTYQVPYQYQQEFKTAQKLAQENHAGLWAPGACVNFPPSAVTLSPARSSSFPATAANNCLIKGNISASGEKIYHVPGCDYYDQTVIDESKGEKWFCTEAEAVQAGWRKAKNCP